ncbi:putative peptidoglycan glycosyltransferase FtsW [Campylobacter sp. 19-13652]|uniref:peptidoglycan glycosyltransferase FtsW n=1 Tax=Campylobacter sp. 19-13652 TaxID=2840180 RepID=UPI001C743819|nr:putative peptidoglycan glycosyltransferase FtsW [Campylobacter sp. 19-13652]BCX79671.1 cell division protein FtsW [Campylobacter sp. 19-13652]
MTTDKYIFYTCAGLILISIVFSLSLSVYTVVFFNYGEFHFFIRQFGVGLLAIFLMWAISRLNPDKALKPIGFTLLFSCLVLMSIMRFLPASMVTESGGAARWIRLPGFSLAPVEFFKVGFIYFLAWSFSRRIGNEKLSIPQEFKLMLPYLCVLAVVACLIAIMQNDLGQVVVLTLTLIMMAWFAGTSMRLFSIGLLLAILGASVIILTSDHRIARIKSWWGTAQDMVLSVLPSWLEDTLRVTDAPAPYQISYSLNAIRHGNFFGEGLGGGIFKLGFLSEVHTDFVLSGIAEELGLAGICLILVLFVFLIFRIFRVSGRCEDKAHHLFCMGVALMLAISFLMNSYGITSLTPLKGIAVPFLSYGGSSMLASSIAIGMVLMISKRIKS